MAENLAELAEEVGASGEVVQQVLAVPPEMVETIIGIAKVVAAADLEGARKYLSADFIDHESAPDEPIGPEGFISVVKDVHKAFPDATWQPEDLFATHDRYAVRVKFEGTQLGEFLGYPPTGKRVSVTQLHYYRVVNGKAVEHWGGRDVIKMLRQLGLYSREDSIEAIAADHAKAAAAE
ncbi:ester cyclase [Amycolatopsis sp. NPDC052450]|uniref:ester cyclase n=1 Tax=Amycolatopsis sp. NPDC052450 TaxID=3363937 RepID=UPI0037C68BCF